jgi:predicted CXXCH cytochrome family protein
MPKPQKNPPSRKNRVPIIATIAAVVAIALLLGGATVLTAARLEEKDSFCASCHSQNESTYYERTQAADSTDLASWHHGDKQTRCIDCHAGPGVAGRAAAMRLGAGDLVAWVTGQAIQPAPLNHPIPDANCLKCHEEVSKTQDFNRHFHAFLPRWQALDPNAATCVSCHSTHTTDGEASLTYLQRDRTVQVCQQCHNNLGGGE